MKFVVVFVLEVYQRIISPYLVFLFGHACRFQPTCSQYTKVCVSRFGVLKGLKLGLIRFSKCHPDTPPSFDPPPTS